MSPSGPGPDHVANLLHAAVLPLGLALDKRQVEQLETHFSLLLRWNEKINLTSLRQPEEIATRHFEECLFLATLLPPPPGLLVDIGSGAGFPGLPLKVAWPSTETVLLEPNQKKAAFLKEVIRHCGLDKVEVRAERLEHAVSGDLVGRAALATARAVSATSELLQNARRLLAPGERLALFLGERDAAMLVNQGTFQWEPPKAIPHSERRVVLLGRAKAAWRE